MALIVQKFGGTSVAKPEARERLLEKVASAKKAGHEVVVVVSAMGRKGDPYATDTLLSLLAEAGSVDSLTKDFMAVTGELISAALIAALLCSRGVPALPLSAYTAGIRAQGAFGDGDISAVDSAPLRAILDSGRVPVVAGFQAVDTEGRIITLGRGGSDTSAVGIGAFLKADYVDIFTDVPGVAAADPRVVPEARFLPYLSYGDMYRLASEGARVLHDKSATLGERYGVKIRVRSTFDDGEGSLIGPERPGAASPALLGIAIQALSPECARLCVLWSKGRSAAALPLARKLAEEAGLGLDPSSDADHLRVLGKPEALKELARRLYAALADIS